MPVCVVAPPLEPGPGWPSTLVAAWPFVMPEEMSNARTRLLTVSATKSRPPAVSRATAPGEDIWSAAFPVPEARLAEHARRGLPARQARREVVDEDAAVRGVAGEEPARRRVVGEPARPRELRRPVPAEHRHEVRLAQDGDRRARGRHRASRL